ncbi:MAG: hypothetical protein JO372_14940 [Solirubrobacterales bacterium]|nr:hypothetical protein [Solirubrobacterales bacterium]
MTRVRLKLTAARYPFLDPRRFAGQRTGIGQRAADADLEGHAEQPLAQLIGPTDEPQRRVEDRDSVAPPLGLLQPVGGEEADRACG